MKTILKLAVALILSGTAHASQCLQNGVTVVLDSQKVHDLTTLLEPCSSMPFNIHPTASQGGLTEVEVTISDYFAKLSSLDSFDVAKKVKGLLEDHMVDWNVKKITAQYCP